MRPFDGRRVPLVLTAMNELEETPLMPKRDVADAILDRIEALL